MRATKEEPPEEQVVEESSVEPEAKTPRRTLQSTPTKYELYFALILHFASILFLAIGLQQPLQEVFM